MDQATPLVVHIIYRLGIGGLENGLVNIINKMPKERYRHAIICLTDATDFVQRIQRSDVVVQQLHKQPGQDWASFYKVYKLFKAWKPAVVHTRNLGAIEYQVCAWLARVPYRVHGEHGWDVFDPDGNNVRYQCLRRALGLIIHRFIPLSKHLQDYLQERVKIPAAKITRICNGVDTNRFYPRECDRVAPIQCDMPLSGKVVIGAVGRMHGVKDQLTLVKAFICACQLNPDFAGVARLWLIGDGPLRSESVGLLKDAGLLDQAWMPGDRDDIPDILRCLDIFVLPSKAEGISNTILEAMATGLPVLATRVGGNPELIVAGETGMLVEKENPEAMATVLAEWVADSDKRRRFGEAGLGRIRQGFSIDNMVARYQQVYDER